MGSLTGPFNRAAHRIRVYNRYRESMLETVRAVNAKKTALREMERHFAARIVRTAGGVTHG